MLSDQEWEDCFEDLAASRFKKFTDESTKSTERAPDETNETLQKLLQLCRVCGSSGLINIKSAISRNTMKVKQSGDLTKWNVSIAQVIQDISGEPVRTSSGVEFRNVNTIPFSGLDERQPTTIYMPALSWASHIFHLFKILNL